MLLCSLPMRALWRDHCAGTSRALARGIACRLGLMTGRQRGRPITALHRFDPCSPLWDFQSFKDRVGDGRSKAVSRVLVHCLPLFKAEALTIARMPAMIASGRIGQEHPEHLRFIYTRVGRY